MPRLTVRAMAELIQLPGFEQVRILNEQKFPKQQPQKFMTPFYAPATKAIRDFYRCDRDPQVLMAAKQDVGHLKMKARRENNLRVIASFESGEQAKRLILPGANPRVEAAMGSMQLKLGADLRGAEKNVPRVTFYNCRAVGIEPETARLTLDIALWVLHEGGSPVPASAVEYVDLFSGNVHKVAKISPHTTKLLKKNVKVIDALWNSI